LGITRSNFNFRLGGLTVSGRGGKHGRRREASMQEGYSKGKWWKWWWTLSKAYSVSRLVLKILGELLKNLVF